MRVLVAGACSHMRRATIPAVLYMSIYQALLALLHMRRCPFGS
jgi:hypothetical protein